MVDTRLFVSKSLTASPSAEFEGSQSTHLLPIPLRQFPRPGEPRVLAHLGKEGRSVRYMKPLHNRLDRPTASFLELHAVFNSLIEWRGKRNSTVFVNLQQQKIPRRSSVAK